MESRVAVGRITRRGGGAVVSIYSDEFQGKLSLGQESARSIASRALDLLPGTRSVVDVGCGIGVWLHAFSELGIDDFVGIDGPWVASEHLLIPSDRFQPTDLEQRVRLDRTFDLVVSMEVAEHLPPARAETFVEDLCRLGDAVLFSAAVPRQGGRNHINEQWPSFWVPIFERQGFGARDAIRSSVWNDERVQYWYRQNAFLFFRGEPSDTVLDLVHPDMLERFVDPERYGWREVMRSRPIPPRDLPALVIESLRRSMSHRRRPAKPGSRDAFRRD